MLNRFIAVGRLTKDVELRYTQDKIAVVSFTIAVDRQQFGKSDTKITDFINCTAWRNTAEFISKYAVKGALVGVDGRLQVRTYENKEGKKVTVSEILCETFQLYEWKKDSPNYKTNQSVETNDTNVGIEEDLNNDKFDLSSDDLPF